MSSRKGRVKKCIECGKEIRGFKDYCAPCHEKILEKIKNLKRGRGRRKI